MTDAAEMWDAGLSTILWGIRLIQTTDDPAEAAEVTLQIRAVAANLVALDLATKNVVTNAQLVEWLSDEAAVASVNFSSGESKLTLAATFSNGDSGTIVIPVVTQEVSLETSCSEGE